jgi:hypothetical protein
VPYNARCELVTHSYPGGKKEFVALIHLPTQLVTNSFVNNHLRYEKRNDTECCIIRRGSDVGFVLELDAGDDHNHNASNHGHGPATSYRCADDDNNDARGRLLIARAGRGYVCRRHGPVGRLRISKSCTGFDRPQVRTSDGFVLR